MKQKIKHLLIGVIVGVLISSTSNILAAGDGVLARFTSFNFVVNGESKTLDTQPLVYNETSYLPVRALSNMLGYDVTFKADSNTIELNKNGQENETVQSNNQIQTNNETNEIQYTKMNFGETYEKDGVKVTLNVSKPEIIDISKIDEQLLKENPKLSQPPNYFNLNIKIELDEITILNGTLWNYQLITDNPKYNSGDGEIKSDASGRIDFGETSDSTLRIRLNEKYNIIGLQFSIPMKNIYLQYNLPSPNLN